MKTNNSLTLTVIIIFLTQLVVGQTIKEKELQGKVTVNSERLVKELLSFEIKESGRVEAAKGQHDDLISALKLAVHGLNKLLATSPNLLTKLKPNSPEPLSISDRRDASAKYFKGLPIEEVKWILGKSN